MKGLGLILWNYAIIGLAISASIFFSNIFVYVLAVVIIAGRQHGLLSLLHEATHGLLFEKKEANHFMANFFCILPLGNTFNTFTRSHLAHHKFLNTQRDPEWYKKTLMGWVFPKDFWGLLRLAFMEAIVRNTRGRVLKFYNIFRGQENSVQLRLIFAIYYLALFGIISYAGIWFEFTLYWLVPYLLVLPYVSFTRSLAEHFGLSYASELQSSRNVKATILNQLFIPHQAGYHLTHHLFPSVPCYNLKEVTAFLEKHPAFLKQACYNDGYYLGRNTMIKDILGLKDREKSY
ncbi:MAG: fatty acid desaturase family protein [Bdellovibrio sp.]|nr:fatty acid desaturase family protein [Bdellovibrio sp.]